MRIDKHIIHENSTLYISLDVLLKMLGISDADRQYWYNYDAQTKNIEKIKNPMDGRKKVYNLDAALKIVSQTRRGILSWGCNLDYVDPSDEDYLNVQARIMSYFESSIYLNSGYTAQEAREIMEMAVKLQPPGTSTTLVPENSTTMAMASSEPTPGVDYVFVGEDGYVSIRSGLTPVFGETEIFGKHPDFDRLFDFVQKTCFGWIDEADDQCMKKCHLQGPCAAKRNELLQSLALDEEQKDAANLRHVEVRGRLQKASSRRNKVSGNVKDWMNTSKDS